MIRAYAPAIVLALWAAVTALGAGHVLVPEWRLLLAAAMVVMVRELLARYRKRNGRTPRF